MNDRIRELAEQAGRWCYDNYDIPTQERFQEKFAELIVQECASIADEFADENLRTKPSDRMKEHFGVE